MREKAVKWRNWIRQQEFDAVKERLVPQAAEKSRLLEIGGGNGFLAKCLSDMGFDVVSIDPEPWQPSWFPVVKGDATNLDFKNQTFDVIFSSNVLEHIDCLDAAFSEMKRVLKIGGLMVHTMPTHYSTIFTLALQPVGYLIKIGLMIVYSLKFAAFAVFRKKTSGNKKQNKKSRQHPDLNKNNINMALKMINPIRFFISWPHGASANCLTEIHEWKPTVWQKKFERAGLKVEEIIQLPVARSRHAVLPFKLIKLRQKLAQRGFSSCAAYLIHC